MSFCVAAQAIIWPHYTFIKFDMPTLRDISGHIMMTAMMSTTCRLVTFSEQGRRPTQMSSCPSQQHCMVELPSKDNVASILVQHRRRWTSIETTLDRCLLLATWILRWLLKQRIPSERHFCIAEYTNYAGFYLFIFILFYCNNQIMSMLTKLLRSLYT